MTTVSGPNLSHPENLSCKKMKIVVIDCVINHKNGNLKLTIGLLFVEFRSLFVDNWAIK